MALGHFDIDVQNRRKMMIKIFLVGVAVFLYDFVKPGAVDEFQDTDVVSGAVNDPVSVHEVRVVGDEVEDAGLLPGTAEAFDRHPGDFCLKLFVKNQFDYFGGTVAKIDGASDPELGFIVQAETPFFFIPFHPVQIFLQGKHIIIFHLKEIAGIRDHLEFFRHFVNAEPPGYQGLDFFLCYRRFFHGTPLQHCITSGGKKEIFFKKNGWPGRAKGTTLRHEGVQAEKGRRPDKAGRNLSSDGREGRRKEELRDFAARVSKHSIRREDRIKKN
jgi:hypothetical protein